jgi:TonB-linked SusC/RagA family outer membrane protein
MKKFSIASIASLFMSFLNVCAQDGPPVSFKAKHISIAKAIDTICRQVGYGSGVAPGALDRYPAISLDITRKNLKQAIEDCLRHTGFFPRIVDSTVWIFPIQDSLTPPAPPEIIVKVVDDSNIPMPGALVCVLRLGICRAADRDGIVRLRALHKTDTIRISYAGYISQDQVVGNSQSIDISLVYNPKPLDEAVVIGYGTTTKRLSTGNVFPVTTKDLDIQPVTEPLGALEGRVAGLVITQTSGVAGAKFTVLVRGQNSLASGKEAFFVINGVPYFSNVSFSNISSGSAAGFISPFNSIDPKDIESIEVLKDADATAIYGSRGANGVILITTRKGKMGRPQLSVNVSSGGSRIATWTPEMNTWQYIAMRMEALRNDGLKPDLTTAPDVLIWDSTRNTNFERLLIGGTAQVTEGHLSLTGGDPHTRYFVAAGYHDESSVFPGSTGYRRISALVDLFHSSGDNRLQTRFSGMLGTDRNKQYTNDLTSFISLAPNAPSLTDARGNLVWQEKGVSFTNPLSFTKNPYLATTDNILASGYMSYHLRPWWSLQLNLGYNDVGTTESSTEPIAAQDPAGNPTGSAYTANTNYKTWLAEPQSDLSYSIGKGALHLVIGSTWESQNNHSASLSGIGFTSDALLGSMNAAQQVFPNNNSADYRYEAYFGRLTSNWDSTWLLNLSGRRDGSSRFGPGRQFGTFGAIGAGWIFSNTPLIKKKFPTLSFGKFRGSYGTSGNDQIGDYQFLGTWSSTTTQPYQGTNSFYPTGLYNSDLAWETIRKLEMALELGFFKDRVTLNTAWYRNRSVNQLIPYNLPFSTGFTTVLRNFPAVVQNSGVEFTLHTQNVVSKKIKWTTQLNLSIPRNKLVSFPDLANSSFAKQLVIGQSIHIVKGYRLLGVDRDSGVYKFYDANHNGRIDDSDKVVIGTKDLSFYGGISNNLRVGSWELEVFVEGRRQTGNNALTEQYNINAPGNLAAGQLNNEPVYFLNRWQKPRDNSAYQQYSIAPGSAASKAISNYTSSSAVLTDASFIRLKTVNLSWHFPDPVLRDLHLAGGRIYLQAQNLLTLTGYKGADPETQNGQALPPLKTIIAGFQITFK